ncbi:Phytyl ester synthase 2, chloroplastic [Linum perenne]
MSPPLIPSTLRLRLVSSSTTMAGATGGTYLSIAFRSPLVRCCSALLPDDKKKLNPVRIPKSRPFPVFAARITRIPSPKGSRAEEGAGIEVEKEEEEDINPYALAVQRPETFMLLGKSLKDYFEEARDLINKSSHGGPSSWITPADCDSPPDNSPLFLYLPGIDGVGLGLIRHHHNLAKLFNTRCLHIPVKNRTPFLGLVQLVEETVREEYRRFPRKPIYLCGESLGACIALAVAARNPEIDLVLILANPGTSFEKSQLRALTPLLKLLPENFQLNVPFMLGLMTGSLYYSSFVFVFSLCGDPLKKFIDNAVRGLPLPLATGGLEMAVLVMSSYLFVLNEILSKDTLLWKLQLLEFASSYVNARLQAVKAQVLILSSGKDQLFPSNEESQRLRSALPKSDTRAFDDNGHFLFLEDGPDLVTIIKGSTLYRRGRCRDYVADYIPPTPLEFKKLVDKYSSRKIVVATNPVMFSTMNDGKIIKGLDGIPSEGPVLIVGYHMLMGVDSSPLVTQIMLERNLLVRGIAHPMVFSRLKDGFMPPLSHFDDFRVMGAAPVSGTALFKLLSSKAHVLLYPGGLREAFHRKGEQYQLFWPERSEFVRMAARFGAKIVPFGVVGEDDYSEVCFDYNDQMKIPFLRDILQSITEETPQLRTEADGGLGGQGLHFPVCRPKLPGRFYFLFGKPIETQGRKEELSRDREKAHELYLEVKQEVYNSIDYLKKKRESDPYRNVLARIAYQTIHGFDSPVPAFEI